MDIHDPNLAKLKYSKPASYRIKIKGKIDKNLEYKLGSMSVVDVDEEKNITSLVGMMKDQAELAGVLNTLYELHYPILSVKVLNA